MMRHLTTITKAVSSLSIFLTGVQSMEKAHRMNAYLLT